MSNQAWDDEAYEAADALRGEGTTEVHPLWEKLADDIGGILSTAVAELEEDGVISVDSGNPSGGATRGSHRKSE